MSLNDLKQLYRTFVPHMNMHKPGLAGSAKAIPCSRAMRAKALKLRIRPLGSGIPDRTKPLPIFTLADQRKQRAINQIVKEKMEAARAKIK